MDKSTALKLVQETLQSAFNKENFVYLVKNILNRIEEAPFIYRGNLIFDDFADSIRCFERVGKYQDPDRKLIDILIVYLTKDTSLERARTKQRNFVAKYLKGSRNGVLKDAALVAFVAPNGEDWRFSLVKMEYKFKETPSGKVKVEEEFTPARRYSFLVGKNENSHTAQSRLLPLLLDDETSPTLEDLENAFSVERVTKEFFEKYHDLFLRLKEALDKVVENDARVRADFKEKKIDTADFAKKLLGQIVFLYFLQKKGWFGVERDKEWGSGSKHFLRELFEKKRGDYQNFFNDILEPLFYEALRLERSGDYYSRFNCRIPFLNGGLFDPINDYDWWNTDILLPNEIFSNDSRTKEGDIGDGILDIFDRYNFTVKEDEPLEKEVAVDPEMLGKVFENLLEIKDRKSKGTYYTPREIVHYMCQESLASYLATELEGKVGKDDIEKLIKYGETVLEHESRVASEGRETDRYSFKLPESVRNNARLIDEKLASIRVCDPSVGSGAFPVGMMNEIVRTRNALTPYIGENGKRTSYHFKRHAIQNCLYGVDTDPGAVEIAKLRLWLSLIVDEESRETVKPLPNLDYKIVQGNSLLGVEKNLFNQPLFIELERLKPLYFNETSASKKQEYKKQIDNLISQITNGHKEFDFEVYFSEVFHEKGGFDVVIGNPPYIQLQKAIDNKNKVADLYKNQNYKTFERTGDIYCLFYELGVKILRPKGMLTYISSNKWMRAGYGEKLRQFFIKYNPLILIDLGPNVFESATVDTNILILQKSENQHHLCTVTYNNKNVSFEEAVSNCYILNNLSSQAWFIGSQAEIKLKEKIERIGKPLKEWEVKIYRGVLTGLNDAFIISSEKRNELLANCKDEEERKRTEAIIKPILRGRDIKRYYYEWAGLWVIVIPTGWTNTHKGNEDAETFMQKKYPSLMNHLKIFEEKAKKRYDKGEYWWELRHCDYYTEFEKEKVVWKRIGSVIRFALDKDKTYPLDSNVIMTGKNIKYICGYLNSKLSITQLLENAPKTGTGDVIISVQALEPHYVPPITTSNQHMAEQIEQLVDEILTAKKQDKNADTTRWEREIDHLVYSLYELTEEEIRIVEDNSK